MYFCKKLNMKQVEEVYKNWMKKDFPKDELKPLSMIKKSISKNQYDCYGFYNEDVLTGYAFLFHIEKLYLLDYFAIAENFRNRGYGSEFIKILQENIDSDLIICEAENPDYAKNDNDKDERQDRINFYTKNKFSCTSLTVKLFGVEYIILISKEEGAFVTEDIKNAYLKIYESFLPKILFKNCVDVHYIN